MQPPTIAHTIRDPQRDVRYIVLAYRELTRAEAAQAVRIFAASRKRPLKRGSTVHIVTTFDAQES